MNTIENIPIDETSEQVESLRFGLDKLTSSHKIVGCAKFGSVTVVVSDNNKLILDKHISFGSCNTVFPWNFK